MSDENPRQTSADSLDGGDKPTGLVSHAEGPQTVVADDVENLPTGKVQPQFSEAPQPETAGTVSLDRDDLETKVIGAPETTSPAAPTTQAETA